jgi:hypothetical protein
MDCYLCWEGFRIVFIAADVVEKVVVEVKGGRRSITGGYVQILHTCIECGCWEGGGSVGIGIESVVINLKGVGRSVMKGLDGELGGGG